MQFWFPMFATTSVLLENIQTLVILSVLQRMVKINGKNGTTLIDSMFFIEQLIVKELPFCYVVAV